MDYLKVSSKSSPASVAGAIAGLIKDGFPVEIQSVGAGAVNQAIKAVAIARGFLIPSGVDVLCAPTFQDIEIDGESRTAIRISVYPCALPASHLALNATQQISGNIDEHTVQASQLPYDVTCAAPLSQLGAMPTLPPLAEA